MNERLLRPQKTSIIADPIIQQENIIHTFMDESAKHFKEDGMKLEDIKKLEKE